VRIYGEDGWWRRQGHRLVGSEPDPPLGLSLPGLTTLTSGFALRADDEGRLFMLRDLAECHHCSVASLPLAPPYRRNGGQQKSRPQGAQ
jgi:hypothetical protein